MEEGASLWNLGGGQWVKHGIPRSILRAGLCDVVAVVLTLEQSETAFVEVKVSNPPSLPGYEGLVDENTLFPEFLNPLREVFYGKGDMMQTWAMIL